MTRIAPAPGPAHTSPWDAAAALLAGHAPITDDDRRVAAMVVEASAAAETITGTWAVTAIEHPGIRDYREACNRCLGLADRAVSTARMTGSTGATYREEGAVTHSATVARVLTVIPD